jgi:hypothetical protein
MLRSFQQVKRSARPGGETRKLKWRKGVITMGKVQNKRRSIYPVSLAIIGWLTFVFGFMVDPLILQLKLLSAARFLP